jgi:hypothetical protein
VCWAVQGEEAPGRGFSRSGLWSKDLGTFSVTKQEISTKTMPRKVVTMPLCKRRLCMMCAIARGAAARLRRLGVTPSFSKFAAVHPACAALLERLRANRAAWERCTDEELEAHRDWDYQDEAASAAWAALARPPSQGRLWRRLAASAGWPERKRAGDPPASAERVPRAEREKAAAVHVAVRRADARRRTPRRGERRGERGGGRRGRFGVDAGGALGHAPLSERAQGGTGLVCARPASTAADIGPSARAARGSPVAYTRV